MLRRIIYLLLDACRGCMDALRWTKKQVVPVIGNMTARHIGFEMAQKHPERVDNWIADCEVVLKVADNGLDFQNAISGWLSNWAADVTDDPLLAADLKSVMMLAEIDFSVNLQLPNALQGVNLGKLRFVIEGFQEGLLLASLRR